MNVDILSTVAPSDHRPLARGPPIGPAACASHPQIPVITSKSGHGGPRANSGGLRSPAGGRPRKSVEQLLDVLRWYCLRTDHMSELLAMRELALDDREVFAPTMWKPAEEMRRYTNGSVRRARPARVVPLFRRYIMVRMSLADPSWHRIKDLPGVSHWIASAPRTLGVPGLPIAVPDPAIEWVRGLLSPSGCLYPPRFFDVAGEPLPLIAVGARVHMTEGPLADRAALCRLSDGKRVEFMMRFFNRDNVPVRTRQSRVEEG